MGSSPIFSTKILDSGSGFFVLSRRAGAFAFIATNRIFARRRAFRFIFYGFASSAAKGCRFNPSRNPTH